MSSPPVPAPPLPPSPLLSYLCAQLHDKLSDYVTEADKEKILSILQSTEDWLYEDGENETKGVYINKLEELKKVRASGGG